MHKIRPLLIGLGTTFVFILMLQTFGGIIWPVAPDVNLSDELALAAARAAAPLTFKLYSVLTYGVAVFVGAFLACKIAGGISTTPSLIVGVAYTVLAALNAFGMDAPLWMQIGIVAMPLPAAWLGLTLARVRPTIQPNRTSPNAR